MIKNYIVVAFRNLKRNSLFSFINIGGLAIGLTAFWMITLYVTHEMSYDSFHANAQRVVRVVQHATWNGGRFNLAVTPAPMAAALKGEYPEIEAAVRLETEGGGAIFYNNQRIEAGDVFFADSACFKVFSYQFLWGDAATALVKPGSIVLTKTLAQKIFGDAALAINKTISFDNNSPALVTGVINDPPYNAHFRFSALRAMPAELNGGWDNSFLYTYLLLKENSSTASLNAKLSSFYGKYMERTLGKVDYHMELQPLTSIHLHSNLDYEISANGNIGYITIFSLVAALILVIASINYMNLSTARSSLRVKEIGVRKVSGSGRGQLVTMFLVESVVITLIASILAVLLLNLLLPWFRHFLGKEIGLAGFNGLQAFVFVTGFSLLAGCLSGIYPALFLSGFKLIPSLKGQTASHTGNRLFRQSLVVFQFMITIAMIVGSLVIWRQMQYVQKKDLGFNKDQVISFHLSRNMRGQIASIKQQLLQHPLIESVATAGNPIGNNNIGGRDYKTETNGRISDRSNIAKQIMVDEDFIPSLQIQLLAGRNFMASMPTDKDQVVIVNETLAKEAGWKNLEGKRIQLGIDSLGKPAMYTVAGIVKDFNIYSLQHKIEPLVLQLPAEVNDKDNMYVRVSKSDVNKALAFVAEVYKKWDAANPFVFSFLDQNFAKQYATEKMQGNLLLIFTVLAILIACLGLFGLVTFTAEQRRKEIGIRKVLGSSVQGIVLLLAKDLMKLVLIAMVFATPIAWLAMHSWLQNFAYHTAVGWWQFAGAGLLALIIAFATVGIRAMKAAFANPVKSLRTE